MSKNTCYAIRKDKGIITRTWGQCKKIIKGNPYQFKGFVRLNDAIKYLGESKENIEFIGFEEVQQTSDTDVIDGETVTEEDTEQITPLQFHNKNLTIYTDGGCIPNPGGKGGIGIVILEGDKVLLEISKSYYPTTNNRMEVMAAIVALESIGDNNDIEIVSDSQYLVLTMNGEYSKKKNPDLWHLLGKEIQKQKSVRFSWVKGHANTKYNERCDELASAAIESGTYIPDTGYRGSKTVYSSNAGNTVPEEFSGKHRDVPKDRLTPDGYISIKRFLNIKKPSFKDYANLKTFGLDTFSRMKEEILKEEIEEEIVEVIAQELPEPKEAVKAMRWYMRGLTVDQSIHKVKVDAEISANAISARYKK